MSERFVWMLMISLLFAGCINGETDTPEPSTQAKFVFTLTNNGIAPSTATFINQSVNAEQFTWHFGTGDSLSISSKNTVHYTYNHPGNYQVSLYAEPQNPQLIYNKTTSEQPLIIQQKPVKRLYFTDRVEGKVKYIALKDDEVPIIESFQGGSLLKPYGMDMDTAHGKLFVMDYGSQLLNRFNWDGIGQEILMNSATENFNSPIGIVVIQNKIYWGEPGGIHHAGLDGSNPEVFLSLPGEYPQDLAYDHINQAIYFSNDKEPESGGVWKVNLNKTGLTQIIPDVWGGAIDVFPEINKLYYYVGNKGMYMAELDGSNPVLFDASNAGKWAWGMAIDKDAGKIYYPNRADMTIMRANTDGSEVEVFIPALANINPNAMTIDTYR